MTVEISCQALGLEELFLAIWHKLGERVEVSDTKKRMLTAVAPELADAIVSESESESGSTGTRIRV
jgi:hypothetical protein